MRRRSGFTLVEVLMVITFASTLLVLAAQLIHRGMTFSKANQSRTELSQSCRLLATQFRRDVHQSANVDLESPQSLVLNPKSARRVEYVVSETTTMRRAFRDGSVYHREIYRFAQPTTIEFELLTDPQRIALRIETRHGLKGVEPKLERNIVAVLDTEPSATTPDLEASP